MEVASGAGAALLDLLLGPCKESAKVGANGLIPSPMCRRTWGQENRRVLVIADTSGSPNRSILSCWNRLTAEDEKNAPSDSAGRFIDRPEGDDRTGFTPG